MRFIQNALLIAGFIALGSFGGFLGELEMVQSGRRGHFHWLVAHSSLSSLGKMAVRFHLGLRLCITSFDSGPILPGPEEQVAGWTARGNVMVSPPLAEGLDIPCAEYDEWYLLGEPPPPEWQPEVFVNYGRFTLVPIEEIYKTFDPTWERGGLDYLVPIQERFWSQMERVAPVSYIAMGDHDVVVSKRREFIEHLQSGA